MIDQHLNLFRSLNSHGVEYLLIGGALSIAYGVPRVTKDIDLFIRATPDNATRLLGALKEIGMGTADLTTTEDVCKTEVTIFKDFVRLDVLTRVKGIEFDSAWRNRAELSLETVPIPSLSIDDLVKTKRAAGRPEDLQDIRILQLAQQQKRKES